MSAKFVGAAARQLSKVQILVLAEYASGSRPIDTREAFSNVRRGLQRQGLLLPGVAATAASGAARRNGARFLRLSAEGRRVLEQAIMMRGGVPTVAAPSNERTDHATKRSRGRAEGAPVHRIAADSG